MTLADDAQLLGVALKVLRILASLPDADARRRVIESVLMLLKGEDA
jgi:hypothetical protein